MKFEQEEDRDGWLRKDGVQRNEKACSDIALMGPIADLFGIGRITMLRWALE
jgi:hypothetical protein